MPMLNSSWIEEYEAIKEASNAPLTNEELEDLYDWYHLTNFLFDDQEEIKISHLRSAVEAFLYKLAIESQQGTESLDRRLTLIKKFSHWCFQTQKLPVDFAAPLASVGHLNPQLAAYIQKEWQASDQFYGIPIHKER